MQILVNPKDKQFAIRACKEDAPNAVPFSKPEGQQKYQIKVNNATVADLLRKMAGWSVEDNWNIPGVYFADEEAIVYDTATAFPPAPKRGGWAAKRAKEAVAAAAEEQVNNEVSRSAMAIRLEQLGFLVKKPRIEYFDPTEVIA